MSERISNAILEAIDKLTAGRDRVESKMDKLKDELADLEDTKASIERDLQQLEQMRDGLDGLSDTGKMIVAESTEAEATETTEESRDQLQTHFDKIMAYLRSVGNSPQLVSTIAEKTGIRRSSVTAVLYRTHAKVFVKQSTGDPGGAIRWRFRTVADNQQEPPPSLNSDDIPF